MLPIAVFFDEAASNAKQIGDRESGSNNGEVMSRRFVVGRLLNHAENTFGFTFTKDVKGKIHLTDKFFFPLSTDTANICPTPPSPSTLMLGRQP